jgi:hypothetical protein
MLDRFLPEERLLHQWFLQVGGAGECRLASLQWYDYLTVRKFCRPIIPHRASGLTNDPATVINGIIDELLGLLSNMPVTSQPAVVYASESTSVPTTEPSGMPHNLYPQLGGSRRLPSRLLPLQEFASLVIFDMVIQISLGDNTPDSNSLGS